MTCYKTYLITACLLAQAPLSQAIDTIKINKKNGLFTAFSNTAPIITSDYIGWERGWKWVDIAVNADHSGRLGNYTKTVFDGTITDLGITFNGSVLPTKNNLTWYYQWEKSKDLPNAIGTGINFNLQLDVFPDSDAPEISSDKKSWRWKISDTKTIEVAFSPAPARLYYEKGNKHQIRVHFFTAISPGALKSTMTIRTTDSVKMVGPNILTYPAFEETTWHESILSPLASPIDLSFLNNANKPAGKQGFVKRQGDSLVFANGQPAKFWGTNLQAYALFNTPDSEIKNHAKRISQLGFNLVRLHHHDSDWVIPNIFKGTENTQQLSKTALQKLDLWIKHLKAEGIYLWLDLHVGRHFTDKDGITHFSDLAKGKKTTHAKGFIYYNNDIQSLMMAFNRAYLTHVNPHTKLAYKDDPAVMGLLITNENDLTHHYGNSLLADKHVPRHNEIFEKSAHQFAKSKGLSRKSTAQTWEMGESKIYLNEMEHRFNTKMLNHLNSLGTKSLVSTTNFWGNTGLFSLPALTDGSIIDAHSYGRSEEFNLNPRYSPGFLTWVGAAQVTGYPLSLSEWNIEPFPALDRFTAPIYTASIASLQGWDAIMLYGYSQNALQGEGWGSNYSSYNDPSMIGLMPAAALLYRQDHVSVAHKSYELALHRKDFFFSRHDPRTSKTLRTLLETSKVSIAMPDTPELPWLTPHKYPAKAGTIAISNMDQDFIPEHQEFVESDTKELKRHWEKGIHTINTAKSQIAAGWIGHENIQLKDVSFAIKTKKAVASVQSVDNRAINQSNKLFITVMARSQPKKEKNKLPFLSESVTGQITITAPSGMKLYPVNREGNLEAALPITRNVQGRYTLNLSEQTPYHWYILQGGSPKYKITSPSETKTYVEGDLIRLKTNQRYLTKKMSHIEYRQDGTLLLEKAKKATYQYATNKLSAGEHTFQSKIIFEDGSKETAEVNIMVEAAPFRILQPYEGDKVTQGQTITIRTNASKWANAIKSVEFWRDEWVYLHGISKAPYEYSVGDLSLGEHVLRTRLTHKDGSMVNATITITVVAP